MVRHELVLGSFNRQWNQGLRRLSQFIPWRYQVQAWPGLEPTLPTSSQPHPVTGWLPACSAALPLALAQSSANASRLVTARLQEFQIPICSNCRCICRKAICLSSILLRKHSCISSIHEKLTAAVEGSRRMKRFNQKNEIKNWLCLFKNFLHVLLTVSHCKRKIMMTLSIV